MASNNGVRRYVNYKPDIYIADKTRNLRLALGNRGQNPLFCVGINPNVANSETSDKTMNHLVELYQGKQSEAGYDSCIMLNPYPLISDNPNLLPNEFDKDICEKNNIVIKEFFEEYRGCDVLASWGDNISLNNDFMKNVITILELGLKNNMHFICLGLSISGNPYHLIGYMRQFNRKHKQDSTLQKFQLTDFDAEKYLKMLSDKVSI